MKFGKYFVRNIRNDFESTSFERPFIPYKLLKQIIKKVSTSSVAQESTSFQNILQHSIFSVEKYYRAKYQELSAELEGLISEFKKEINPQDHKQIHGHCKQLCEELSSLRFYAVLNETAVQKITKKFDKKMTNLSVTESFFLQQNFISKLKNFEFCQSAKDTLNQSAQKFLREVEQSMTQAKLPFEPFIANDEEQHKILSMLRKYKNQVVRRTNSLFFATKAVALISLLIVIVFLFLSFHVSTLTLSSLLFITFFSFYTLSTKLSSTHSTTGAVDESILFDKTMQEISPLDCKQMLFLLPTNIFSRLWGMCHSIPLPQWARKPVFLIWTIAFGCKLEEMRYPIESYSCLGEFFSRPLKDGLRKPEEGDDILIHSPVDGRVVSLGKVQFDEATGEATLEQIKGLHYSLNTFLGKSRDEFLKEYKAKQGKKQLYQMVIYLAPGDYHRIHSPVDMKIQKRMHFPGALLPVNAVAVRFVKGLFAINERVVLEGEWTHPLSQEDSIDKFYMVAVGALNVGSVALTFDSEVKTNNRWQYPLKKEKDPQPKLMRHHLDHHEPYGVGSSYVRTYPDGILIEKCEETAYFKLGSTVVLVFEVDADIPVDFSVKIGQKVRMGQKLVTSSANNR